MEDYVKADLVNLIKDLTGETKLSPMIQGQIQRYVLELGMSFKEIARCLVYWVEVKGQSLSPAYGIGIVPSIRKPAADYFKQLELEREEQVKQAKKAIEYEENIYDHGGTDAGCIVPLRSTRGCAEISQERFYSYHLQQGWKHHFIYAGCIY